MARHLFRKVGAGDWRTWAQSHLMNFHFVYPDPLKAVQMYWHEFAWERGLRMRYEKSNLRTK